MMDIEEAKRIASVMQSILEEEATYLCPREAQRLTDMLADALWMDE